jgi:hypothetical protein
VLWPRSAFERGGSWGNKECRRLGGVLLVLAKQKALLDPRIIGSLRIGIRKSRVNDEMMGIIIPRGRWRLGCWRIVNVIVVVSVAGESSSRARVLRGEIFGPR